MFQCTVDYFLRSCAFNFIFFLLTKIMRSPASEKEFGSNACFSDPEDEHFRSVLEGATFQSFSDLAAGWGLPPKRARTLRVSSIGDRSVQGSLRCPLPLIVSEPGAFEPHQAAAVGKVKLPADPQQRVTLLHQKTVAQIKRRVQIERRRRPVESVEHVLTAAVENIKQRDGLPCEFILWGKHEEIGHQSHTPGGIAWSIVEIGDRLVAAIVRIERVVHLGPAISS